MIDLVNYKDPNITQYRIFDKRNDDQELNMAENNGSFLIDLILGIDPNDNIFSDFQRPGSKVIDTTRSQEKLIVEKFLR